MLEIITYGNPILRQKADKVEEITDEIVKLVEEMELTLSKQNGVGLAAPQIGISKRIVVIDLTKAEQDKKIALINPQIVWKSSTVVDYEEGCLSFPETWGVVVRPNEIKVKADLKNGKSILLNASGFLARVLQLEIDHLDGVMFIDHLSEQDLSKQHEKLERLLDGNRKKLGKAVS
jgi:peptide deformylase